MTEFTAQGAPGLVAFATKVPGHILPVEVQPGRDYMIHRHGFLCSTPGVELSVGFQQSLGAGIFGGDGFPPATARRAVPGVDRTGRRGGLV